MNDLHKPDLGPSPAAAGEKHSHVNPLSATEQLLQRILMRVRPAPVAVLLKKIFGVARRIVVTPRGRFWTDPISNLGAALTQRGEYEPEMARTLGQFLKAGATFVDVGANEGYFSVLAVGLVGPSGKVLSIEPQTRLIPIISENLKLNDAPCVNVVNVALSDTKKPVQMYLAADINTGASGIYKTAKYNLEQQSVQAVPLAQLLDAEGCRIVDLMKVDIEGAEYEMMLGAREVFESGRVRAVALELHPHILAARGLDPAEIVNMLERAGYRRDENAETAVWVRH